MTTPIPHLSAEDMDALGITAEDSIAILTHLLRGAAEGTVWGTPKSVITPPDDRYVMSTLSMMSDPALVVTKTLVLNPENTAAGLAQINGLVSIIDGVTGLPLATLDNNWVTGVRTAALSALAARHLARSDSRSIAFIGTGLQARTHLDAFAQLFPLAEARIFGRGRPNIETLSAAAEARGLSTRVCTTPEEAITGADLVVTTITHTGISGPFLDAAWLAPGSFAAIVDLAVPWKKDSFAGLDRLIIDDLAQEEALPAKLADPADVDGDLTGLVTGTAAGRRAEDERTAFAFRGLALGDLALAALAYLKAQGKSYG